MISHTWVHQQGGSVVRLLVEHAHAVRISAIRRAGAFDSGSSARRCAFWIPVWDERGGCRCRVHAHGGVRRLEIARASGSPSSAVELFELVPTFPNYGGTRWWIVCSCGRRVAALYRSGTSELEPYRCRTCAGLVYSTQRESSPTRLLRRAEKLRCRLGQSGLWPVERARRSCRPRWMRRRMYHDLLATVELLEGAAIGLAMRSWP